MPTTTTRPSGVSARSCAWTDRPAMVACRDTARAERAVEHAGGRVAQDRGLHAGPFHPLTRILLSGWISTPLPCVGAPPQPPPSGVVTMPDDPKVVSRVPSVFRRATATLVPVMSELVTTILPFGWSAMSPSPAGPRPPTRSDGRRATRRPGRASRSPCRRRSSCRASRSRSSAPRRGCPRHWFGSPPTTSLPSGWTSTCASAASVIPGTDRVAMPPEPNVVSSEPPRPAGAVRGDGLRCRGQQRTGEPDQRHDREQAAMHPLFSRVTRRHIAADPSPFGLVQHRPTPVAQ